MSMSISNQSTKITIVTPSFEKHFIQFSRMIETIHEHCVDPQNLNFIVIVEQKNQRMFSDLMHKYPSIASEIILTEDVLSEFGIQEKPIEFLLRIGKFTFQSIKKLGGLVKVQTPWSLVLDSECLFLNTFSAFELLENYRSQKYIFYTETKPRGGIWRNSTGYAVTQNCAHILSVKPSQRWYMEYFHWFYETAIVEKLVDTLHNESFFINIADKNTPPIDVFENILYYTFLEKIESYDYNFVDFKQAITKYLPPEIADRFKLDELPFSLFGNDYLLNIFGPAEIHHLAALFSAYKLPFIRLEPLYFSVDFVREMTQLPYFVATVSSHHMTWLRKRIAVCISGEFRHILHRTPEQHIRHLLGFLSGVDCDIYIHGWCNTSEALIIDQLKPKAYKFEKQPDFTQLSQMVAYKEPTTRENRDRDSLRMFYSIQSCWELLEDYVEDYDYVVRIRPDIYMERSFKELLVSISDEGDFMPNAIYFPKSFHSQGINDQFAIGPVAYMRAYMHTFDFVKQRIGTLYFNPEYLLLYNLSEQNAQIAMIDAPYALMREEYFKIGSIRSHFEHQFHVWWSRSEHLPLLRDVSDLFADKMKTVEAINAGILPYEFYIDFVNNRKKTVLNFTYVDKNPVLKVFGYEKALGCIWRKRQIKFGNAVCHIPLRSPDSYFFFYCEDGKLTLSIWYYYQNNLINIKPQNISSFIAGNYVQRLDFLEKAGLHMGNTIRAVMNAFKVFLRSIQS